MSPTLKSTGGWDTLCTNLGVFPLEQTRHVGVAKSERPKLTDGEIISEEFQPMWSQSTNVTDKQTTCDRNTALCTKVHRAVKSKNQLVPHSGFNAKMTSSLVLYSNIQHYIKCKSLNLNANSRHWFDHKCSMDLETEYSMFIGLDWAVLNVSNNTV